jgi:hypothetical protein
MDNQEKMFDACRSLAMTLELAWAARAIAAPRSWQASLGEDAKRVRRAIAELVGSDEPYAAELAERMERCECVK